MRTLEQLRFLRPPLTAPRCAICRRAGQRLAVVCRCGTLARRFDLDPAARELCRRSRSKADGKEMSTTMAVVRLFSNLLRDKTLGPRLVPIVADEARTFGMANLFRQIGIYSPDGPALRPRRTPGRCSPTAKHAMGSFSRRASPRPARCPRGWRRRPPTACMGCACCRSTSITPCSASSEWAI